jgi:ribonuclease Y
MTGIPVAIVAIVAIVAAASGFAGGWFAQRMRTARLQGDAREVRDRLLREAEREASALHRNAEIEAKDLMLKSREAFNAETSKTRLEQARRGELLDEREMGLSKKILLLDQKELRLENRDEELKGGLTALEAERKRVQETVVEQNLKLEYIAGLTAEDARRLLEENILAEARASAARRVRDVRDEAERHAKREAQQVLSLAVQRYASEHVAETVVSVVDLPSDDMKGRIIGREGRNIRAFELATGIDVIIDDTPEAVIISGFDPVRREVARLSLQKLIRDGRIHPGRIEEVVVKTRLEMMEKIREIGEQVCLDLNLQKIHPDLHPYIGRLHYRTSYGQNLLLHCKEVAAVAAIIASELGLDHRLAQRCGFLHDIGKAAEHEMEGPHALVGARLLKKYGENEIVLNAVGGHHQDLETISPYTFITTAADAVSASRPGARRESLENYVKRLEGLEKIADSFAGVEKSYAIQAGREIRILINPSKLNDAETALLAEEISRRVEGELEYPGQIKVTVIRETRAVAYAR